MDGSLRPEKTIVPQRSIESSVQPVESDERRFLAAVNRLEERVPGHRVLYERIRALVKKVPFTFTEMDPTLRTDPVLRIEHWLDKCRACNLLSQEETRDGALHDYCIALEEELH
jgi:hypothetical protein